MSKKFLTDQEINLNENDFLKTKIYADNLAKIIRSTQSDMVFTIGLYGSWGSGKSSIIETSKQSFDEKKDKVKFVTYDAWQYSNDSFRRMFLRTLSKELKYSETDFMKRFYENESRDVDNEFKLSYTKSVYVLIGLIGLLFILSFFKFEVNYKISIFSIITLLGTLVALFSGVFHQLKVSVTKPYVFAPEQFEDCFKEIATKALKKNSLIDKLKYINDNDYTIKNLNKLIIIIDNIDRCNSEVAYQLLTDIKTFLGSQKFSIVFVIPVDDKALLKNFFSKETNTIKYNDKEEFLRKIFNVTLRIKPYNTTDMFAFTKGICAHNGLNFKNETINIIGKEYSNNPRRVIQLLNNLIVELDNYDSAFSKENETIICCILIIREEYPEFYDLIYMNASLLINYDATDKRLINDNVERFMRIAKNEFREISNEVSNKILTNSKTRFTSIPIEIIEIINTFDTENISKYLKENEVIDEEIYNYLCHKIDETHDNELLKELSNYMEFVALMNQEHEIPRDYLLRIFEKLNSRLYAVFFHANNLEILLDFIKYAERHFRKYKIRELLIETITGNIHSSEIAKKERWITIFNSLISCLKDQDTSIRIKDDYERFYPELITIETLDDVQFKILVTKKFIETRVKEVDFFDINEKKYLLVKHILHRFEDKLFVVNTVFEKLNSTNLSYNNLDTRYNYVIVFNDFIKEATVYVKNYKGKYLNTNINPVFNELDVFSDSISLEKKQIYEAYKDEKDKLIEFLNFIYNYFHFTNNLKILEEHIIKLNYYFASDVRKFIVELKNNEHDITFYYRGLKRDLNLDDNNLVDLIKYYLTLKSNDFHIINAKENQRLVEDLLLKLKHNNNVDKVNDIFINIIQQTNNSSIIFTVFNNFIRNKNYNFLNNLDSKLKQMFADELELNDYTTLIVPEILTFCFFVDNEILNQKIKQCLEDFKFNISSSNSFLELIIPQLKSNSEKAISKLIISTLVKKFEGMRIGTNNTFSINKLKENINILKNLP